MQRSLLLPIIVLFLSACTNTQNLSPERELPVETLTVSEVYGAPAKVAVTLEVAVGACEQLEVRQRLEDKTLRFSVIGYRDSTKSGCSAETHSYTETVISEVLSESGTYTVIAGDERATFVLPSDYQPNTVKASIQSVDVVPKSDFGELAVYVTTFYGSCDSSFYRDVSQRRERDTFFITFLVLGAVPAVVPSCPPVLVPFTERVVLESQNLTSGIYKVDVNGVVETFTFP